MAKDPINPMKEEKRRLFHDLFLWLALIPLIFGSLFACGQLALILVPEEAGAITRSLLKADYLPWAYNLIPPINVEAFIQDVVKEQQLFGPTGMPEVHRNKRALFNPAYTDQYPGEHCNPDGDTRTRENKTSFGADHTYDNKHHSRANTHTAAHPDCDRVSFPYKDPYAPAGKPHVYAYR